MPFRYFYFSKGVNLFSAFLMMHCLSSCFSSRLAVYTDYLTHETLASYYVETPDPLQNYPMIGQRLIVIWTLKKSYLCYKDLHLKLDVRFRNKKETSIIYPITNSKGTYIYSLLNQDYIDNDGILTYKVELIGDGILLDEWKHQMWTTLIVVGQTDSACEQEKSKSLSEETIEFESKEGSKFKSEETIEFEDLDL